MDSIIMHYIVDLSSNNNFVQVPAVQGDGNETRYIEIELIENGIPYVVDTEECDITIIGTKPDGTQIWNTCSTTQEGFLLIEVTHQMTVVAGRGIYQIMIFAKGTNSQLKSFPFYMLVTGAAFDPEHITSTDEFEVLTTFAQDLEVYSERAEEGAADAEAYAAAAATSAANAATSESNAVTAASTASTASTSAVSSASSASTSATNAATSAVLAESWAVGGTNTRTHEDINNSAYWCHHAQEIVDEFAGQVDVSGKADKVSLATSGDLAGLDANGNLTDSGKKPSDFAATSHTHTVSQISDLPTFGTAATLNVAASGNASTSEVVKGDDTRLTDARTPTSHSHEWSEVTNKPFASIGNGLTVSGTTLTADVKSVSVATSGTASSTGARKQTITINGTAYTINNSFYMEQSVTLITSGTKSISFNNSGILSSSRIDVYCSDYSIIPTNVVASSGTCTVTLPQVTSQKTITCGIEVKN